MCWAEEPEDTNLMISVVYTRDGERGAGTVLGRCWEKVLDVTGMGSPGLIGYVRFRC